ncbi:cyclic nucleotide-gated channel alpha-3-like [Watersipora subatra]|uniref:cyclic nucleotide-gated channel alpha-3-like n=1 Tax=Watersipora subatra TaxID=2589382 RepID=UPI00355BF245
MSVGSQRRHALQARNVQSVDGLLLLPRGCSALSGLNLAEEKRLLFDDSSGMPYNAQLLYKRKRRSSSIVMERRRHIGAKLSNSNGTINHVHDFGQSGRQNLWQYFRNKLPCFRRDHTREIAFDPEVTITRESVGNVSEELSMDEQKTLKHKVAKVCSACECYFEPSSRASYWWSFIVCLAVLYNYWVLIFRYAFDEITSETALTWLPLDYSMDLIYLLDIFKGLRTAYLDNGVLQTDAAKMRTHYKNTMIFYFDCLCLLPLDFIYLSVGYNSMLRSARLMKVYKLWKFLDITERHTNFPNLIRTCTMIHYLFLMFHWNASVFFIVMRDSAAFDDTQCDNDITPAHMQYIHSLYWSVMSLSTIAQLPQPRQLKEYLYTIITMVLALLLFATIMGTVAQIVSSMHTARKEFQATLDDVKTYMSQSNVPQSLQARVIRWFDYLWQVKRGVSKTDTLNLLPERLKAEIAIHIHLETLKKVAIFQNTEAGFLKELVLRLEPALFSPGDFVCRKGEIGKEMYIVKKGELQVMDDTKELAVIRPGGYFGEISILNMGDIGNKRTASVISIGYSDLFCLKKDDMCDVLRDYPLARVRLEEMAMQRLLGENEAKDLAGQRQQQTVKPFNHQGELSQHQTLSKKSSIGSTSSRMLDALQLPQVKINYSPVVSRKDSFLTNDVYLNSQTDGISLSLRSSARSMHSDVTRSVRSSSLSLHQTNTSERNPAGISLFSSKPTSIPYADDITLETST